MECSPEVHWDEDIPEVNALEETEDCILQVDDPQMEVQSSNVKTLSHQRPIMEYNTTRIYAYMSL